MVSGRTIAGLLVVGGFVYGGYYVFKNRDKLTTDVICNGPLKGVCKALNINFIDANPSPSGSNPPPNNPPPNNPPPNNPRPNNPPTGYVPPSGTGSNPIFAQVRDGVASLDASQTRIVVPCLFSNVSQTDQSCYAVIEVTDPTGHIFNQSVTFTLGAGKDQQFTFTTNSLTSLVTSKSSQTYLIDVVVFGPFDKTTGERPIISNRVRLTPSF